MIRFSPGTRATRCLRPDAVAVLAASLGVLGATVCQLRASDRPVGPPPIGNAAAVELPGLHNVFHLSAKLYSGSAPEGDAGFESLRRLGVRTILTVDGARPDVERARRCDMRYAHIPFGYDGCPRPTADRIARAVRDLPGPIYLHCHHGKHRAPTAAALVRIALDGISNAEGVKELERAGTGKNYIGLYATVRTYAPPTPQELDRTPAYFPEVAPTPPLRAAMLELDGRLDNLTLCRRAGWQVPREHPDLLPAHEALQLRELLTELLRTSAVKRRPDDFQGRMRDAETRAGALEAALESGRTERAGMLLEQVGAGSASCHARYRDVPEGQRATRKAE
jgi:protein tyrosine phosphatase (PTP) superfamily phosphohydrolase (DUF442 family)